MSDIVVKYTGEGDEKSVLIEIQNEMLGLPNHRSLNDIVNEEKKTSILPFLYYLPVSINCKARSKTSSFPC